MREPARRQLNSRPLFRKLRVFAVDPGLTAHFETVVVNEMTLSVPWESVEPGPAGEYVEVVDEDEHGTRLNAPLDLNRPDILALNGLPPSDGNQQFHQQMLYAVAMKTIRNFERALGRRTHWPPTRSSSRARPVYAQRLRLYPHFARTPNAYYSPDKGVAFGYFESPSEGLAPGTTIFTCLSQDVIAHELAHALLRGMSDAPATPRSEDQRGFEEAFADLIALFQHFEDGEVLREQIADVRGDVSRPSPLGMVALQLGELQGRRNGVRNALGSWGDDGEWRPRQPDPNLYRTGVEVHERGDILVAAVFMAFRKIYESRVADLQRIASQGTGVLPEGHLHPDLVARLSQEAAGAARNVLHMCIRALDYLPPLDITFGDFLRAIITADHDLVPDDQRRYRIAFLQAFRAHGITPPELGTMSVDTLLLGAGVPDSGTAAVTGFVRELAGKITYWGLPRKRHELWERTEGLKGDLTGQLREAGGRLGAIDLTRPFQIAALDLSQRAGDRGELLLQWVIKVVQRPGRGEPWVGSTLLVGADSGIVRYRVDKPAPAARASGKEELLERSGADVASVPPRRSLRVFAFDPGLGAELESAAINEVTLEIPWERRPDGSDALEPGPVGEYLEVIDHDPASRRFYAPVNLNEPYHLARDGLDPSESNPQFHQQMVYAVTMRIIRDFEHALGRLALWAPHWTGADEQYVQRLRVYPHALREANAYYSPEKKALLFGYFGAADDRDGKRVQQPMVFTCLSHDIVAHEVTHALLDGIHRRFHEPSNPDVLAFHEAFADIVALFEHFSLPAVLRHQIAATRGDLASQNRLGELAQQFGRATGSHGALRSAIGRIDKVTGAWEPIEPDPDAYQVQMEPHDRGAILVAAVFEAFLNIYKARISDLLRIATQGTGVLPAGQLHPDLVDRLAAEAASSAKRVLHMCIRALDYCPPVDITFGDYLRAIITADFEYDPLDSEHRRIAFAEAFRRYGIVPERVRTLSVDGLLWQPTSDAPDVDERFQLGIVRSWADDLGAWGLESDRKRLFELMRERREALHRHIEKQMDRDSVLLSGIDPGRPFEVHSIRPSMGSDWSGRPRFRWVIELTQRLEQFLDPAAAKAGRKADYYFRGGTTLVVRAETGRVLYGVRKTLDNERQEQQRRFILEESSASLAATYFGNPAIEERERFAMLHRF